MKIISTLLILLLIITSIPFNVVIALDYNPLDNFSDLIEYNLRIVELDTSVSSRIGLNELNFGSLATESFYFLNTAEITDLMGIAGRALLQVEAYKEDSRSKNISEVKLLTLVNYPVNLKLSEEILVLEASGNLDSYRKKELLEINLFPERIDRAERVLTGLNVKNNLSYNIESKIWSEKSDEKLIGLVKWDMSNLAQNTSSALSSAEQAKSKYFTLYLSHRILDDSKELKEEIMRLDGLDKMLWPEDDKKLEMDNYFQVNSRPDINLLMIDYNRNFGIAVNTTESLKSISAGFDALVYDDLRLGLRGVVRESHNFSLGVAISERVEINRNISLEGSYYPFFFDLSENKLNFDTAWWGELTVKKEPLMARLKYSSGFNMEDQIDLSLGYKFRDKNSILVGASGTSNGVENYYIGLRIDF